MTFYSTYQAFLSNFNGNGNVFVLWSLFPVSFFHLFIAPPIKIWIIINIDTFYAIYILLNNDKYLSVKITNSYSEHGTLV